MQSTEVKVNIFETVADNTVLPNTCITYRPRKQPNQCQHMGKCQEYLEHNHDTEPSILHVYKSA